MQTHCNTLQHTPERRVDSIVARLLTQTHCITLPTHCKALQTHCNTLQHTPECRVDSFVARLLMQTRCITLHHTATHCNTLQQTATHCNTHQSAGSTALSSDCCRRQTRSHVHVCCSPLFDSLISSHSGAGPVIYVYAYTYIYMHMYT